MSVTNALLDCSFDTSFTDEHSARRNGETVASESLSSFEQCRALGLRREGRRVTAYRVLDDVNHGKVPACSMGFRFYVSSSMSIIRETRNIEVIGSIQKDCERNFSAALRNSLPHSIIS